MRPAGATGRPGTPARARLGQPGARRQRADQRLRAHPGRAQVGQGDRPVTLRQARTVRPERQRHVPVGRHGNLQQPRQRDLARRRGEQVNPPDDVGDAIGGVVHDHRELVGEEAVGTPADDVAGDLRHALDELAVEPVTDRDRRCGHPYAHRRPAPGGGSGVPLGGAQTRTGAGVAAAAGVRRRGEGEVPARAVAAVGVPRPGQLLERLAVGAVAGRLRCRLLIPVEAEPAQVVADRGGPGRPAPLPVEVIHPKQHPPAPTAHVQPRQERRARIAQVHEPAGAGCEPSDHHRTSVSRPR